MCPGNYNEFLRMCVEFERIEREVLMIYDDAIIFRVVRQNLNLHNLFVFVQLYSFRCARAVAFSNPNRNVYFLSEMCV